MSSAALDRLLAVLLVAELATGLLSLRAGIPATAPLFWIHGVLAGSLLVAALEKVRRSLRPALRRRRWSRIAVAALLSLFVAGALVGGFAWVASGRILSIGPWTVLTLHVWAALAVVPVVVLHLLPRRFRVLRPPPPTKRRMTRRGVLALGGTLALGAVAWGAANALDLIRGGGRRFTGSRELVAGGVPPTTTFYGEGTPEIDAAEWRLAVRGRAAHETSLSLEELAALGTEEREATLDCTSGWAMRTAWRGTPLSSVLAAAAAAEDVRRVTVTSATGWLVRLDPWELDDCLLATHVAGEPLPAGNGAPCRLVAPTRRGLDWIKWVASIDVG
ncbi:MAG TPA: molybdopterin-dependent oxidoreductase [Candidatus Limnocylindria bacterium]|nr:molybdopterin-dependent oxidoreductase [Candidatus Limnocylindria bacterium]